MMDKWGNWEESVVPQDEKQSCSNCWEDLAPGTLRMKRQDQSDEVQRSVEAGHIDAAETWYWVCDSVCAADLRVKCGEIEPYPEAN